MVGETYVVVGHKTIGPVPKFFFTQFEAVNGYTNGHFWKKIIFLNAFFALII